MAVDTRDRRASCLGIAGPYRVVWPNPGALSQADRQHMAYTYPGIQAQSPAAPAADTGVHYRYYWARKTRRWKAYKPKTGPFN